MTDLVQTADPARGLKRHDPARALALFLDFDGTLVEIAPVPDAVKVDRRLGPALDSLRHELGGALALVSGRPIPVLDDFLKPHVFDAAGLHGAQIRLDGEIRAQAEAPDALRHATRELIHYANSHVGIIVEDKRISVALHWRLAPELKDEALALLDRLAAELGPSVRLQKGKSVAEIVPAGASKGGAIDWLMRTPAYAGRCPVFIGDDITDEAGFATVNRLGGVSVRIGPGETCASHRLASPTILHGILLGASERRSLTLDDFSQD